MPFETQVVIGAIILVFLFFMVLVAWAERRAGGSFDNTVDAKPRPEGAAGLEPVLDDEERQAA